MNARTRRRLAALLAGALAAFAARAVAFAIQRDACLDAGGRWLARGSCESANRPLPGPGRAYVVSALVGLVVLAVAWRAFTFAATRASRPAR